MRPGVRNLASPRADWLAGGSLARAVFAVALATSSCSLACAADPVLTGKDYLARGIEFANIGDLDMAIRHYNEALRRDPNLVLAYVQRGDALASKGDPAKAIKDYAAAGKLDPKNPVVYNNLAWLQATCADEQIRDGKKALINAKWACELTEWKAPSCFDTLAGAYAEAGDFANAVKWAQKAIAETTLPAEKQEMERHLKSYQAGQPFREPIKKQPNPKPPKKGV